MKTQQRITLKFNLTKPDDVELYHEYISLHSEASYRVINTQVDGVIMIEACFPEEDIS